MTSAREGLVGHGSQSDPTQSGQLGATANIERMLTPKRPACYIEPMLLLRTDKLSEGNSWSHELKLDGFRAVALSGGFVHLRSRNRSGARSHAG